MPQKARELELPNGEGELLEERWRGGPSGPDKTIRLYE
jgi:hypothetical protein